MENVGGWARSTAVTMETLVFFLCQVASQAETDVVSNMRAHMSSIILQRRQLLELSWTQDIGLLKGDRPSCCSPHYFPLLRCSRWLFPHTGSLCAVGPDVAAKLQLDVIQVVQIHSADFGESNIRSPFCFPIFFSTGSRGKYLVHLMLNAAQCWPAMRFFCEPFCAEWALNHRRAGSCF